MLLYWPIRTGQHNRCEINGAHGHMRHEHPPKDCPASEDFITALGNLMTDCGVDRMKMSGYGVRLKKFRRFCMIVLLMPSIFPACKKTGRFCCSRNRSV